MRTQGNPRVCSVSRLYLSLCDPMDCSPPGSSVHGIAQARILEWAAIPFSRGSSWPRDWGWISYIAADFISWWAAAPGLWEPPASPSSPAALLACPHLSPPSSGILGVLPPSSAWIASPGSWLTCGNSSWLQFPYPSAGSCTPPPRPQAAGRGGRCQRRGMWPSGESWWHREEANAATSRLWEIEGGAGAGGRTLPSVPPHREVCLLPSPYPEAAPGGTGKLGGCRGPGGPPAGLVLQPWVLWEGLSISSPRPQPHSTHILLSVSEFDSLGISCKWDHTEFILLGQASYT